MNKLSRLNIKRIMSILESYDEQELIPHSYAWSMWQKNFLFKLNMKGRTMEFIKKFPEFRECGNYSQKEFDRVFSNLEYDKYIHPMNYKMYTLSKKEKQRIAFVLQEEIPVSWDDIYNVVDYFYKCGRWDFNGLIEAAGCKCKRLQARLSAIDFLESKGIFPPDKKAS